ncbi:PEP-CTERM sorting domain-containing protein [Massilia soli]|uniref:PEP-CTERM sorting domain-containing protein n=1 Tax=Massilia soli TaxID=2792854 RepID=A0ABS7SJY0_9BURK|nr:PEP-CTERM sorting domain-containing protein [Massilia soli]MBZ2206429.1 PEP-CTERM sorting domain-containing protein [Massilia soli]
MFSRLATLLFASLLLTCAPSFAAPITIDFESYPGLDGKLGTSDDVPAHNMIWRLSDEFATMGITFVRGSLHQSGFFDGNPANHFLSSDNPIISLGVPVFGISMMSKSYWDATLTAYGASGNVLAIHRLEHFGPGTAMMEGLLSVTTSEAIASFSILPDRPNYILNLDNLVLDVVDVPEPSNMLFAGLGLLGLVMRAKRRPRPFA